MNSITMNNIIKIVSKANSFRPVVSSAWNLSIYATQQQRQMGSLWYMCRPNTLNNGNFAARVSKTGNMCNCDLQSRQAHTKAEQELVEFLTEEIIVERKALKMKTIPTEIDGFKVQLNGAEVTLTKNIDKEKIKIQFNINHTVDTEPDGDVHPNMDKADMGELKSKPSFKIDIVRGNTTTSLVCSFVNEQQDEGYNDIFGIDEISIFEGDWNENIYSVSGEVIDSYLYDLILNYLDEKGINNEFVEKLSQYSTTYEHSAYISLLEGLSKFVSEK